jgi:hypothetical protein
MRAPYLWSLAIITACIAAAYVFKVGPRTRRQWTLVAITLAFVLLVLPFMAPLR